MMIGPSNKQKDQPSELASRRRLLNIAQVDLARSCGISRQFLSMLETGKVQPNVQVALRLASVLGSTVETLFTLSEDAAVELDVCCANTILRPGSRVNVAKVRDAWVAHPADTPDSIGNGFSPADGVLQIVGKKLIASCHTSLQELEGNIIFAGCDPAMGLLCNTRLDAPGRSIWVNCGSGRALEYLSQGLVHVAGLHYGQDDGDENLRAIQRVAPGANLFVMRFSTWEQGWLLGKNVQEDFSGVEDLIPGKLRIANRESGAAVRHWLDTELASHGIPPESVPGYDTCHLSHSEAVDSILAEKADVMLGPCVMASMFGLRFIPIGKVAFDIAFHRDLFEHPRMDACLKWLGSKRFQQEISTLPGYTAQLI